MMIVFLHFHSLPYSITYKFFPLIFNCGQRSNMDSRSDFEKDLDLDSGLCFVSGSETLPNPICDFLLLFRPGSIEEVRYSQYSN